MKILRLLIGALLALLLLVFVVGSLLPRAWHVERSVQIAAAPAQAYALVVEPARWKAWTVWNRRDPAMQIAYFGPASGVGAGWSWRSASEGDGKMTLTAASPGQRVAYELYFPDMDDTTHGELRFEPQAGGTRVTWTMDGDMGRNPLKRWLGLLMDRLVGPDFAAGLANLKTLAEQHP